MRDLYPTLWLALNAPLPRLRWPLALSATMAALADVRLLRLTLVVMLMARLATDGWTGR